MHVFGPFVTGNCYLKGSRSTSTMPKGDSVRKSLERGSQSFFQSRWSNQFHSVLCVCLCPVTPGEPPHLSTCPVDSLFAIPVVGASGMWERHSKSNLFATLTRFISASPFVLSLYLKHTYPIPDENKTRDRMRVGWTSGMETHGGVLAKKVSIIASCATGLIRKN